jgi:3-deoxy-manno-octulosonate cytidylyltransferase (CMP-KDO synthetase)
MRTIGIVPARMASSRYPGKPLAKIHGMPMIGHVWHRCRMSKHLDEVYIATCDDEIMQYAASIGAPAIMTKDTHERCTERTAEALAAIEAEGGDAVDIVVMIQGDEPMTTPEMVDDAVRPMLGDASIEVVNLVADIATREEHEDPNEIKVVTDLAGNALYFSRAPIPSNTRGADAPPWKKQVCVIPFRRDFLLEFDALAPTPLEILESVDMMRVLEHGKKVRMVPTSAVSYSVDNEEDHRRVEAAMQDDPVMKGYLGSAS